MKQFKIDIYKSILLLILGVFTYCYYSNSKKDNNRNGRFTEFTNEYGFPIILDTKTGATYRIKGDGLELKLHTPALIKQ
jgi:hypothetical protein